jgi:hypothetical protein
MKFGYLKSLFATLVAVSLLLGSCSRDSVQEYSTQTPTSTLNLAQIFHFHSTQTSIALQTLTPTIAPSATMAVPATETSTPSAKELATMSAESILSTLPYTCKEPTQNYPWQGSISPDGRWAAIVCFGYSDGISHYIHAVNLLTGVEWDVQPELPEFFVDYFTPIPFHWSRDGKYLFIVIEISEESHGYGHDASVIRLDLMTGKQEMLMEIEDQYTLYSFTFSDDDQFLLSISQSDPANLTIKNLKSLDEQKIPLGDQFAVAGNALLSPEGSKVVFDVRLGFLDMSGPIDYEERAKLDTIGWVDLGQPDVVTIVPPEKLPEYGLDLVKWADDENIMMKNDDEQFWLINVNTLESKQIQN